MKLSQVLRSDNAYHKLDNRNLLNEVRNWDLKPGQYECETFVLTTKQLIRRNQQNNSTNKNKTILANAKR